MPLEIGEIGISVQVAGDDPRQGRDRAAAADPCASEQEREQREDLVDECVRRVLTALRAERER